MAMDSRTGSCLDSCCHLFSDNSCDSLDGAALKEKYEWLDVGSEIIGRSDYLVTTEQLLERLYWYRYIGNEEGNFE